MEHDTDEGRVRFRDEGLVARIVQHEIDHLDGVLFIDHLTWGRKIGLLPRLATILVSGWLQRAFGNGRPR